MNINEFLDHLNSGISVIGGVRSPSVYASGKSGRASYYHGAEQHLSYSRGNTIIDGKAYR